MPTILSLQSHVVYGHVGNAAAVFPLQRLGAEVWALNLLQFSNHPGYSGFAGEIFAASHITALLGGLEARGILPQCDAILSGYLGTRALGEAVLDGVGRVKAANPDALYACDPVMGDSAPGVYVQPDLPDFFRHYAVPRADILTPNLFELGVLTGREIATRAVLHAALDACHAMGPRIILVTSVMVEDTPIDAIDLVVSAPQGRFRLRTPKLEGAVNGAGDMIAALFLYHILKGDVAGQAMARAASSVFGIIRHTKNLGKRELAIIPAQEQIVRPSQMFVPQPFA
jgi:pyridoxine kinase